MQLRRIMSRWQFHPSSARAQPSTDALDEERLKMRWMAHFRETGIGFLAMVLFEGTCRFLRHPTTAAEGTCSWRIARECLCYTEHLLSTDGEGLVIFEFQKAQPCRRSHHRSERSVGAYYGPGKPHRASVARLSFS